MKIATSLIIGLLCTLSSFAQTTPDSTPSTSESAAAAVKSSLTGSMYEIVACADNNDLIFFLNKETGEVKYLSFGKYINISRQETPEDVAEAGKINYQLVMSSTSVYLINLNGGTIWYLKSAVFTHGKDKFVLLKKR